MAVARQVSPFPTTETLHNSPNNPQLQTQNHIIPWESLPDWQHHTWPYRPNEISPKSLIPQSMIANTAEALKQYIYESESDNDASNDSDEDFSDPLEVQEAKPKNRKSRFPFNEALNCKISLHVGDPTVLDVGAVVNPTAITSTDKTGLGARILQVGGPELAALLTTMERAKTGEVRPTAGFGLVAPTILHTVGPRYSEQYLTAAESALHNCYRSALDYCAEFKIRTLAVPPIHTLHRSFPTANGAHIAIRTIRRLLELRPAATDRIILVFEENDYENIDVYFTLLKLYFPRSKEEESIAAKILPPDRSNQYGEIVVEERKVRINATFGNRPFSSSDEEYGINTDLFSPSCASTSFMSTTQESLHDQTSYSSSTSLPASMLTMSAYKDSERRQSTRSSSKNSHSRSLDDIYSQYLALANTKDLSTVSTLGLFYHAGNDFHGRPIIAIVGCRMPADHNLHDLVFLHYIKFMDEYANSPYVVLYIHTNASSKKKPEISWFRKVYSIVDAKYGQSLVAVHVLHPTFWLKVVEKLASVFMSSTHVLDKIVYHDRLVDLCTAIRSIPRLPNDIMDADASSNGPLPQSFVNAFTRQ